MAYIAARIDGRLIHGQVANLWTSSLSIGRIMVVDNEVATSDIEKAALKMATPSGVRLSVLPIEKAAANITSGKYASQRLLIVAKRPSVFLELVLRDVELNTINVGNMSQTDETHHISQSINVLDEDVEAFRRLRDAGVTLTAQMVPSDESKDLWKLLGDLGR